MDRNQNENSPLAEKDPVDFQELFEPMTFYELIVPEPSDLPEAMAFYKQVSPQRYALIHSMNSTYSNTAQKKERDSAKCDRMNLWINR